jgi:hypothetical protein
MRAAAHATAPPGRAHSRGQAEPGGPRWQRAAGQDRGDRCGRVARCGAARRGVGGCGPHERTGCSAPQLWQAGFARGPAVFTSARGAVTKRESTPPPAAHRRAAQGGDQDQPVAVRSGQRHQRAGGQPQRCGAAPGFFEGCWGWMAHNIHSSSPALPVARSRKCAIKQTTHSPAAATRKSPSLTCSLPGPPPPGCAARGLTSRLPTRPRNRARPGRPHSLPGLQAHAPAAGLAGRQHQDRDGRQRGAG